jgi:hypothetical protein
MLLLALVAVVCLAAISRAAQRRDAWEYEITGDLSTAVLRDLGAEGWEVTAAATDSEGRIRVILKRRKN